MTADSSSQNADHGTAQPKTVAETVLEKFFDELTKTEGFADIGPKLREVVVDQGTFSEAAIRAALFPESP